MFTHFISACTSPLSTESIRESLQVKVEGPESDVYQADPLYTGQPYQASGRCVSSLLLFHTNCDLWGFKLNLEV